MNKKKFYLVIFTIILCFNFIFLTVKLHFNEQDDKANETTISYLPISSSVAVEWYRIWGGSNGDYGYGAAVDSLDNIYVTGLTASYGVGVDMFLVKYDTSGVQQWSRIWGWSGYEEGRGVAVDSSDNIYVTGSTTSFAAGYNDMFLVKYDTSGVQLWNRTWGGSKLDQGEGLAVDSSNNVYVTGSTNSYGEGDRDLFLVKYNSFGVQQWNLTWGTSLIEYGQAIAIDSLDNVYVSGYTTNFGVEGLLIKYDSSGKQQWNRTWGGLDNDYAFGVGVDSSDNVYISGDTESQGTGIWDIFLVKYDSSGMQLWNRTWGGYYADAGMGGLIIDSLDGIYLAGETSNFGALMGDMVLVKYNSSGVQQWNSTWRSPDIERTFGSAIDSSNNIYLTGYIIGPATGDFDVPLVKFGKFPDIIINSPNQNEFYGSLAPDFDINITEPDLDTTWYTLDGGTTNITFSGLTGTIDQTEWDMIQDGVVNITFYANNTAGNIGYAEVTIFKDSLTPQIIINLPIALTLFGNIAPSFDISITESFLNSTWYTIDEGVTNVTFSGLTGTIDQTEWDLKGSGIVTIRFYANDTLGKQGHADISILKDIDKPVITINYPVQNQVFEDNAPTYDISVVEANLDTMWYTLDGGVTNFTITQFTGTINQNAWNAAPYGYITIRFYAKDLAGNIGYSEVIIEKREGLPIALIIILSSISGIIIIGIITAIYLKKRHK